jgi:hypothetical protein
MYFLRVIITFTIIVFGSDTYICKTNWVLENNKKYYPPDSIKNIKLELYINWKNKAFNSSDYLTFSTKNYTSIYRYDSILNLGKITGLTFKRGENLLDFHSNGDLYLFRNNKMLLKATCPRLKIELSEIK